eukprot:g1348.t1
MAESTSMQLQNLIGIGIWGENLIDIGIFAKLPGGIETACGIILDIIKYLDILSMSYLIQSSLLKQLSTIYKDKKFITIVRTFMDNIKKVHILSVNYKKEFPDKYTSIYKYRSQNISPFICACEHGRLNNVQAFIKLHKYYAYANTDNTDIIGNTVKEFVNQLGTGGKLARTGRSTGLMVAAKYEHIDTVRYLLKCGADADIVDPSSGELALHWASLENSNTGIIELLLKNMSPHMINHKAWISTCIPQDRTALDQVYKYITNRSPARNDIIKLIRKHGGKANYYDTKGNEVGKGYGDLNVVDEVSRLRCKNERDIQEVQRICRSKDVELLRRTLCEMSPNNINYKNRYNLTILDIVYETKFDTPNTEKEFIQLIRQLGGKANYYDINGNDVGEGYGDLNAVDEASRLRCKNASDAQYLRRICRGSNIGLIRKTLYGMSSNAINHLHTTRKIRGYDLDYVDTVLDDVYKSSRWHQFNMEKILQLLRQHGGKSNCYDMNGNYVGEFNGDLHGEKRATLIHALCNVDLSLEAHTNVEKFKKILLATPNNVMNQMNPQGWTVLDLVYNVCCKSVSMHRQYQHYKSRYVKLKPGIKEIIRLIRQRGGKANKHSKNGIYNGPGNGALNGEERGIIIAGGTNEDYKKCTDLELVNKTLKKMPLNEINKLNTRYIKNKTIGETLLDAVYSWSVSPIRNEIIASIRKHGGKANYHDINGNKTPEWDSIIHVKLMLYLDR